MPLIAPVSLLIDKDFRFFANVNDVLAVAAVSPIQPELSRFNV
jgi:hypothetical protein